MAEGPTPEQRLAADPDRAAWVGANAGSGKTRVLTHRVARLLLAGSRPERILCLTYTKAAAAEMQGRLFKLLGGWSMAEDEALARALQALTGAAAPPSAERLVKARRLFAQALETPGGLRIQTIHAFCEQLLRRFPLEAGVSPRFRVADDRRQTLLGREVSSAQGRAAATGQSDVIDRLAARTGEHALGALQAAVSSQRDLFPATPEAVPERLAAHFPAIALAGEEAALRDALAALDWPLLSTLAGDLSAHAGENGKKAATKLLEAATRYRDGQLEEAVEALQSALITTGGEAGGLKAKEPGRLVTKGGEKACPGLQDRTAEAAYGVLDALARIATARVAARAGDLNAFAADWLMRYGAAKEAGGVLDFADLVGRAAQLLTAPGLAPWVLWKLDGGIEHILVDEAQDTSPEQWQVIDAIAAEFHAGEGARGAGRTLFAVGDEKQSIYSFQGADPAVFAEMRATFRERFTPHGGLAEPALERSFRSAPGILDFVDRVFGGPAAAGLVAGGAAPRHVAHHATVPATVDFWEAVPSEKAEKETEWWEPVDRPHPGRAEIRLAHLLAREVARMTAEDTLPARDDKPACAVKPDDILILVRRRGLLFHTLVRRLKAEGVPVAGADRIVLAEELAVQDLLAALKVAAFRHDDLALAALLRSPLGDASEEALFALAHGRAKGEPLWRRLLAARATHPRSAALFEDLAGAADYARPYELLERILVRHDGRARLLARLGGEAEDAIDELLVQALDYEAEGTPSLAGFIAWIEGGGLEVKRQMGDASGEVRVMTVHGAKGLEAPIVILPDTLSAPGGGGGGRPTLLPLRAEGNAPPLMLWAEAQARDDALAAKAREAARARETAEFKRLLYVALTRAETRLLLCGAGKASGQEDEGESGSGKSKGIVPDPAAPLGSKPAAAAVRWYRMLEAAVKASPDCRAVPAPEGVPAAWRIGVDPSRRAMDASMHPAGQLDLTETAPPAGPPWLDRAAEEPRRLRITPSALAPEEGAAHAEEATGAPDPGAPAFGGDLAAQRAPGRERDAALLYGTAVHLLLEHLPDVPAASRAAMAPELLADGVPALAPEARAQAIAEVEAVLTAPFAAALFGPGSHAEAGVGGALPHDGTSLLAGAAAPLFLGRIDRLVVTPDRVLAVDYKSDARPAPPDAIPPGYLAQLGAYGVALARLYPGREIALALLWTALPRLDDVDPAAARSAFEAALSRLRDGAA